MSKRLIPNGDLDFKDKVLAFASTITRDPGRFNLTPADAHEMMAAATRFGEALVKARTGGRSQVATLRKVEARAEAERVYRRCMKVIRRSENLEAATLVAAGLRPAEGKRQSRACPQEPPRLKFLRALHEGGATPVHELEFRALDYSPAKPAGAARLELFVDLIAPDEPIPEQPGANHSSRPWYLRSYTRSPIRLIPPMARVPMRVVYWARWADAVGNVGPFSATAVAWIEGGTHRLLPGGTGMGRIGEAPLPILEEAGAPGPAGRERTYVVAVLEAQYESLNPQEVAPALRAPEQREAPRLEERDHPRLEDQSAKEAA